MYLIQICFCLKLFTGYVLRVKQYKAKWLTVRNSKEENRILKERTFLALLHSDTWRKVCDIK
jgi:hypothetical protein